MAALFSAEWMNALKEAWNADPEVRGRLEEIGFNSIIACGFKDEDQPRGVFVVEKGACVRAGDYDGSPADWDMRATPDNWAKWAQEGIGMAGAGQARACPKGGPVGVCSFGYFSCTSKKSDSPACVGACLKGLSLMAGEKGLQRFLKAALTGC
ncbi:MAG: SCP-2 sterol transfer family protein [Pseudomonadota bacterium]